MAFQLSCAFLIVEISSCANFGSTCNIKMTSAIACHSFIGLNDNSNSVAYVFSQRKLRKRIFRDDNFRENKEWISTDNF